LVISRLTYPTTRPFVLGVIGDSVTQRGSFASTYENTWVEIVKSHIAAQCPMGVTRVDSVTYHDAQGSTSLSSMSTTTAIAGYPTGCDMVIVGLGTNDCREQNTDGSWTYSPTSVYNNAQTVYAAAVAANPNAFLLGLGIWDNSLLTWAPTAGSRTVRFDALIAQRCVENGGLYIPVSDLWDYSPNRLPTGVAAFGGYTTDGFHPNDSGHAALASRVLEEMLIP
jgi:acyl-CoA thioesterase-1